ncbi:hypothetical protein BKI52_29660 [marine bacterium AO1-C]|nr:hypothetical protein BKI52_29660 [marine bacterium AO1-C]
MQLPPLAIHTKKALELGKHTKTCIIEAGQLPALIPLLPPTFAITQVSLQFCEEKHLCNCVRILQWSSEMFKTRPKQLHHWSRGAVYRKGLQLFFTVHWYKEATFNKHKDAFLNDKHAKYYAVFDATPQDLIIEHKILAEHL